MFYRSYITETGKGKALYLHYTDNTKQLAGRRVGNKQYEQKGHLGNVRAVVSDERLTEQPKVLTASNYYPFGMLQPNNPFSSGDYRFGFQGQEMDNDMSGGKTGAIYDYGFRIYDTRIAKFLSVDPLTKSYPWYTPYQFAGNTPIRALDLDGLEILDYRSMFRMKYQKRGDMNYYYLVIPNGREKPGSSITRRYITRSFQNGDVYKYLANKMLVASKCTDKELIQYLRENNPINVTGNNGSIKSSSLEASDIYEKMQEPSRLTGKPNGHATKWHNDANAVAGGAIRTLEKALKEIYKLSPGAATVEAKRDISDMLNAYETAFNIINSNVYDFMQAAEGRDVDVEELMIDVMNYVVDKTLPSIEKYGKSYQDWVRKTGTKFINKNTVLKERKKLRSSSFRANIRNRKK